MKKSDKCPTECLHFGLGDCGLPPEEWHKYESPIKITSDWKPEIWIEKPEKPKDVGVTVTREEIKEAIKNRDIRCKKNDWL